MMLMSLQFISKIISKIIFKIIPNIIQQMITSLVNEGKGELDHSGIATFIENISGIKISSD